MRNLKTKLNLHFLNENECKIETILVKTSQDDTNLLRSSNYLNKAEITGSSLNISQTPSERSVISMRISKNSLFTSNILVDFNIKTSTSRNFKIKQNCPESADSKSKSATKDLNNISILKDGQPSVEVSNNSIIPLKKSDRSIVYTPSTICNYYQMSNEATPNKLQISVKKLNFSKIDLKSDENENIPSSSRNNMEESTNLVIFKKTPIKYIKSQLKSGENTMNKLNISPNSKEAFMCTEFVNASNVGGSAGAGLGLDDLSCCRDLAKEIKKERVLNISELELKDYYENGDEIGDREEDGIIVASNPLKTPSSFIDRVNLNFTFNKLRKESPERLNTIETPTLTQLKEDLEKDKEGFKVNEERKPSLAINDKPSKININNNSSKSSAVTATIDQALKKINYKDIKRVNNTGNSNNNHNINTNNKGGYSNFLLKNKQNKSNSFHKSESPSNRHNLLYSKPSNNANNLASNNNHINNPNPYKRKLKNESPVGKINSTTSKNVSGSPNNRQATNTIQTTKTNSSKSKSKKSESNKKIETNIKEFLLNMINNNNMNNESQNKQQRTLKPSSSTSKHVTISNNINIDKVIIQQPISNKQYISNGGGNVKTRIISKQPSSVLTNITNITTANTGLAKVFNTGKSKSKEKTIEYSFKCQQQRSPQLKPESGSFIKPSPYNIGSTGDNTTNIICDKNDFSKVASLTVKQNKYINDFSKYKKKSVIEPLNSNISLNATLNKANIDSFSLRKKVLSTKIKFLSGDKDDVIIEDD